MLNILPTGSTNAPLQIATLAGWNHLRVFFCVLNVSCAAFSDF
jgi:hypothetical protein